VNVPPPDVVTITPNPAIDWTLTISGFAAGQVNRVERQRQNAGGKGVNVAGALAEYGLRVGATGFLGEENAAVFERFFADAGITDGFVRIPGRTRVGIKVVDPAKQETTDINFAGAAPRPEDAEALRQRLEEIAMASCPWFVLAGSLPPGVEPTLYRDLALMLKALGCRVAVDASGDALRYALEAAPHVVKPNVHEMEALHGEPLASREAVAVAARELVAQGIELAVVSMGAEGAVFAGSGTVAFARPPRIPVHSTVGAGDAMVAGIVAGRLCGLDVPEIARLATAFSVCALSHQGAGIGSAAAVTAWLGAVDIG
jgi:1-phosphofructokinase